MMRRVCVIGLDGGTWDLLHPLVDRGIMPNLGRLMSGGVCGPLTTCFPPSTGPAWVSIATGRNPGKHGIYNFLKNSAGGLGQRLITSADIQVKTLWEILSDHDRKVGVINVPISYPPQEVNGFVVSGLMTPSVESGLTYPRDLTGEILKEIGDYIITVRWTHYGPRRARELVSDLRHCHRQRGRTALYLMEKKPWDFFMTVFTGTDRIQHALWNYLDPGGYPEGLEKDPSVEADIHEYYRDVDRTIGEIQERLTRDDILLIVSDHGFGAMAKKVHMNRWLEEEGYLKLKRSRYLTSSLKEKSWRGLRKAVAYADRWKVRRKLMAGDHARTLRRLGGLEDRFTQFYRCVDWKRTRAFVSAITDQTGIYINLEGRSPLGTVPVGQYEHLRDEIIERLKSFTDPDSGEPIITSVVKREEYYTGPFTKWAPDILVTIKDCEYSTDMFLSDSVFEVPDKRFGWGCHRMDGIFVAHGGPVKRGDAGHLSVYDICPTVLYLMGLPIPDDVDGRAALDILEDSFTLDREPEYAPTDKAQARSAQLSAEDENELRERLRGLGYLS
ncbi:MAG: alkaline phosphatase family protein [Candidatus Eisenbacteria bacterium]